jgi:DNA-binding response OmpR family regulator
VSCLTCDRRGTLDNFKVSKQPQIRVLVVDDDEPILESLEIVLGDRYQVHTAENGARALEVLEQHEVDVVVLDLMMPVLDGIGFMTELGYRGVSLPVVVISAGYDAETQLQGLPAAAFLKKPFDVAQLERAIEEATTPDSGGGGSPPGGGSFNEPDRDPAAGRQTRHRVHRPGESRFPRPRTAPAGPGARRVARRR